MIPSERAARPLAGDRRSPTGAAAGAPDGRFARHAGRCFVAMTGVLVAFNVTRAFGLLGPPVLSGAALAAASALVAWRAGATAVDLGLARKDAGAGARYGAATFALVVVALLGAAAIPATSGFLDDSRAQIDGGRLAYELVVSVTLVTAIPEELAFRGVLLGSAVRLWGPWRATVVTSVLFGLWHVAPTLHTLPDNSAVSGASGSLAATTLVVLGAVAATAIAGLAFGWLRLRSRSLVAPIVAHVATNGLALAVAWVLAQ